MVNTYEAYLRNSIPSTLTIEGALRIYTENFDAFYQRYRVYTEDDKHLFFHETRERKNGYGPCTEKGIFQPENEGINLERFRKEPSDRSE